MTDNIEKSSLWAELAKVKQPTKLVDLPVYDDKGKSLGQVIIRTLLHDDHIAIDKQAVLECDRTFSEDKDKPDRTHQLYRERLYNITAKHFLFRCVRDPEDINKPFFPTPDHVGKYFSNNQIAILMKNYQTLEDEKGPLFAYMDSDQLNSFVETLATDAENNGYFLDRILPEAQNQLIVSMANLLWSYQTGKSSPTLPPNESTPEPIPQS
jgi:hypothetical protein